MSLRIVILTLLELYNKCIAELIVDSSSSISTLTLVLAFVLLSMSWRNTLADDHHKSHDKCFNKSNQSSGCYFIDLNDNGLLQPTWVNISTILNEVEMPRFHLPFSRRRRYRKTSNIRSMLFIMILAVGAVCLAPLYFIYKPPHSLIRYFQYRWPDVLWHVPATRKVIALTIDDAPSRYTEEILELLQQNNATATFFIIGSQAEGQGQLMAEMVRAGHELGNHAMRDERSRDLTDANLREQLDQVQTTIDSAYELAQTKPAHRFFRPGGGFLSSQMRKTAIEKGYQIVLGSIYPHDPQIPYSSINSRHILSMARAGGIIICHDRRSWTLPMLRTVLPELKRRGFEIVTLGALVDGQKK